MASQQIRATRKPRPSTVTLRELMLAGLGAAAIVRRQGEKLFSTLVNEGRGIQQKGAKLVEQTTTTVQRSAKDLVGQARQRVNSGVQSLERGAVNQVGRVLDRLGVPSRQDIRELSRRVAQLNEQVKVLKAGDSAA